MEDNSNNSKRKPRGKPEIEILSSKKLLNTLLMHCRHAYNSEHDRLKHDTIDLSVFCTEFTTRIMKTDVRWTRGGFLESEKVHLGFLEGSRRWKEVHLE